MKPGGPCSVEALEKARKSLHIAVGIFIASLLFNVRPFRNGASVLRFSYLLRGYGLQRK